LNGLIKINKGISKKKPILNASSLFPRRKSRWLLGSIILSSSHSEQLFSALILFAQLLFPLPPFQAVSPPDWSEYSIEI
jgi:hypothetical protein